MKELLGRNLGFILIDTFLGFSGPDFSMKWYLIFMGIDLWALG